MIFSTRCKRLASRLLYCSVERSHKFGSGDYLVYLQHLSACREGQIMRSSLAKPPLLDPSSRDIEACHGGVRSRSFKPVVQQGTRAQKRHQSQMLLLKLWRRVGQSDAEAAVRMSLLALHRTAAAVVADQLGSRVLRSTAAQWDSLTRLAALVAAALQPVHRLVRCYGTPHGCLLVLERTLRTPPSLVTFKQNNKRAVWSPFLTVPSIANSGGQEYKHQSSLPSHHSLQLLPVAIRRRDQDLEHLIGAVTRFDVSSIEVRALHRRRNEQGQPAPSQLRRRL